MKRTLLALTAVLLIAADPKDDPAAKEVLKALEALNAAFKDGKADVIKSLLTDDHLAITPYYGGAVDRAEQLRTLPDLKLTEYKPGAMAVRLLAKDVALVSYPLTMKGTFKGKEVAARNHAVAIWVNQKGKWLESSYQETALETK